MILIERGPSFTVPFDNARRLVNLKLHDQLKCFLRSFELSLSRHRSQVSRVRLRLQYIGESNLGSIHPDLNLDVNRAELRLELQFQPLGKATPWKQTAAVITIAAQYARCVKGLITVI